MDRIRSLLFVPADRPRFLVKAGQLDADGILLDLEDGVAPAEKAAARAAARAAIPGMAGPVWVRVNGLASGEIDDDLAAIADVPGLRGIMLPKTDRASDVQDVAHRLDALESRRRPGGGLRIIAMIESALGVLSTFDIATATPRIASVCLGGARGGDLQADLGAAWSSEGPELLYARQHVLLAARAAGIGWPVDGVYADVRDSDGFERDSALSRRLGYRGRTVIHPDQVRIANAVYVATDAELADARAIIEAADAAAAAGLGTTLSDGRLVDVAMVRHARRILADAGEGAAMDGATREAPDTGDRDRS